MELRFLIPVIHQAYFKMAFLAWNLLWPLSLNSIIPHDFLKVDECFSGWQDQNGHLPHPTVFRKHARLHTDHIPPYPLSNIYGV